MTVIPLRLKNDQNTLETIKMTEIPSKLKKWPKIPPKTLKRSKLPQKLSKITRISCIFCILIET